MSILFERMAASDLISIISIVFSSSISILSLSLAWKEKKHQIRHTEKYNEWKELCDVVSQYIMSVTPSKLDNYLRRAAAAASKESVTDFFALTESHLEAMELWTMRVQGLKEVRDNADLAKKVKAINEFHKTTIIRINDLKAVCALDKPTSSQLSDIAEETRNISKDIGRERPLFDEIEGSLQKIISAKAAEIKK